MGSRLSLEQMLQQLEAKIALHKERQAFHAQQETHHREQAAVHAAELSAATERYEALRAAVTAADELLEHSQPAAPQQASRPADEDLGRGRPIGRMIARVVEDIGPEEIFGPTAVTREIHKRWGAKLRRKVDPRTVAATLRRWALYGRIHQTRKGKAYRESLYVKKAPAAKQ